MGNIIVAGPQNSGKTTLAMAMREPDDFAFDARYIHTLGLDTYFPYLDKEKTMLIQECGGTNTPTDHDWILSSNCLAAGMLVLAFDPSNQQKNLEWLNTQLPCIRRALENKGLSMPPVILVLTKSDLWAENLDKIQALNQLSGCIEKNGFTVKDQKIISLKTDSRPGDTAKAFLEKTLEIMKQPVIVEPPKEPSSKHVMDPDKELKGIYEEIARNQLRINLNKMLEAKTGNSSDIDTANRILDKISKAESLEDEIKGLSAAQLPDEPRSRRSSSSSSSSSSTYARFLSPIKSTIKTSPNSSPNNSPLNSPQNSPSPVNDILKMYMEDRAAYLKGRTPSPNLPKKK